MGELEGLPLLLAATHRTQSPTNFTLRLAVDFSMGSVQCAELPIASALSSSHKGPAPEAVDMDAGAGDSRQVRM